MPVKLSIEQKLVDKVVIHRTIQSSRITKLNKISEEFFFFFFKEKNWENRKQECIGYL